MPTLYTLIVDTNEYSGDFEREMCAYITGQTGECGVGGGEASDAEDEVDKATLAWFENNIEQRGDEHGCFRPCAIVPTPGRVNNGTGGHYNEATYKGEYRYPAYESVGIFLNVKPTAAIFRLAQERAKAFAAQYKGSTRTKKLRILNVRLTKGVRMMTDVDVTKLK